MDWHSTKDGNDTPFVCAVYDEILQSAMEGLPAAGNLPSRLKVCCNNCLGQEITRSYGKPVGTSQSFVRLD